MGYQNFGVTVTSYERRVERSCGIQSNFAVRHFRAKRYHLPLVSIRLHSSVYLTRSPRCLS